MLTKCCAGCRYYEQFKSTIADKEYTWYECTNPEQIKIQKIDVKRTFSCKHYEKRKKA